VHSIVERCCSIRSRAILACERRGDRGLDAASVFQVVEPGRAAVPLGDQADFLAADLSRLILLMAIVLKITQLKQAESEATRLSDEG
jgi:hypothetical protein